MKQQSSSSDVLEGEKAWFGTLLPAGVAILVAFGLLLLWLGREFGRSSSALEIAAKVAGLAALVSLPSLPATVLFFRKRGPESRTSYFTGGTAVAVAVTLGSVAILAIVKGIASIQ